MFGSDTASDARTTDPAKQGELAGYTWAAWWQELDYKEAGGVWEYVIYDPDGNCVTEYKNVAGMQRRWQRWRILHPVTDLSIETLAEMEVLGYILRKADYSHVLETVVRQVRAGEVKDLLRKQDRKKRRREDRIRAARFFGCAPEQVSSAKLDAYRHRGGTQVV